MSTTTDKNNEKHSQYSQPNYNSSELYEISRMIVNYIRRLKNNIKRNNAYVTNLARSYDGVNKQAKRSQSSKALKSHNQENEKMIRIKQFEESQKHQIEERYKSKQSKREKVHEDYLKDKVEKIKIMKEKNEIKGLKSKVLVMQNEDNQENQLKKYEERKKQIEDKIRVVIKQRQEDLKEKSTMRNYKLQKATERHNLKLNSLDERAKIAYFNHLSNSKSEAEPEGKNMNHLDYLISTGRFEQLQQKQFSKIFEIQKKIEDKDKTYSFWAENNRKNKEKKLLLKSLEYEDKIIKIQRNKKAMEYKNEKKKEEMEKKDEKIKQIVQEKKNECRLKLQIKQEIDELKNHLKAQLSDLLVNNHNLTPNDIRASLVSIIPPEFLDNQEIMKEINSMTESPKNKQNENMGGTGYEMSKSTAAFSGSTWKSTNKNPQLKQNTKHENEMLEMLAKEKLKEEERMRVLEQEKDPVKRQKLKAFFDQERLKATDKLIAKQSEVS